MDHLVESPLALLWYKSLFQLPIQLKRILPNFILKGFTPLNSSIDEIISPWIKQYRMTRILCVSAGPSVSPWIDLHQRITISARKSIQFHLADTNLVSVANWQVQQLPAQIKFNSAPQSTDLRLYLHMNNLGPITAQASEQMIRDAIESNSSVAIFDIWKPRYFAFLTWILFPIFSLMLAFKEKYGSGIRNLLLMFVLIPIRWIGEMIFRNFFQQSTSEELISSQTLTSHIISKNYIWTSGLKWHSIWPIRYVIVYPKSITTAKRLNE